MKILTVNQNEIFGRGKKVNIKKKKEVFSKKFKSPFTLFLSESIKGH